MKKHLNIISILIAANALLFIIPLLFKVDLTSVFALYLSKNNHFGIWQYVTHLFIHGSSFHLLFNMYGLWVFGTPLVKLWGSKRFLLFYFLSGIGAGIIYTLINHYQFNGIYEQLIQMKVLPSEIQSILDLGSYNSFKITISREQMNGFYRLFHESAIGSSGAIYGILVAFSLIYPNAKLMLIFLPVPIAAKYFIPILIAGDLFFGFTQYSIGNVAHFAHVAGALIGFLITLFWEKTIFKRCF